MSIDAARDPQPVDPTPPPAEVIEAAKQEARTLFQHTMQVGMQVGNIPNPVLAKVTSENISEGLRNAREDGSKKQNSNRIYFIGTILTVIALSWMFLAYDKAELLEKLLPMIVSLAIGFAGGYGVGKSRAK